MYFWEIILIEMSNIDDKKKALALVLDKLDKTYGKGTVMTLGDESIDNTVEVIPSGSLGLDIALGIGGYPKGRIIEIYETYRPWRRTYWIG